MQRRGVQRLGRLALASAAPPAPGLPAQRRRADGGSRDSGPRSSKPSLTGGLALSASLLGFLGKKKRPYEESDCRDPLNTALSYAWLQRRMEGDLDEALEVFEWVQGKLEDGVEDPYVAIRFNDQSGDFRFQLATRPPSPDVSDAERFADFERALLHYSLAYQALSALPSEAGSGVEQKAQLRLLQLKSAQAYWALGSGDKAEAIYRKALEGQARLPTVAKANTGFMLPPVTAADFYTVEGVDIFNGRCLLFSSEALLGFCHERLGLFLAGSIAPLSATARPALPKDDAQRLREAKDHVLKALAKADTASNEEVQHAFALVRRFVEELLRLSQTVQAGQFLVASGKALRGRKGKEASALLDTGLAWLRAFDQALKEPSDFVRIPPLHFANN